MKKISYVAEYVMIAISLALVVFVPYVQEKLQNPEVWVVLETGDKFKMGSHFKIDETVYFKVDSHGHLEVYKIPVSDKAPEGLGLKQTKIVDMYRIDLLGKKQKI